MASTTAYDVTVPAGSAAGDLVNFRGPDGSEMSTRVPEGVAEGESFRVEVLEGSEVNADRLRLSAQPSLLSLHPDEGASYDDDTSDWLEDVLDALTNEKFVTIVDGFLLAECHKFLTSAGEHTMAQTDVHLKYQRLYESRIESLMKRHQVEPAAFVGALLAANAAAGSAKASDHASRRQTMLSSLLAIEDFSAFSTMMRQRAAELDA